MKSENISDMVVEHIMMCSNVELANLTVKDIANTLGKSSSYIYWQFLKEKKFPLGAYLVKIKIFRAASTLRNDTDISVIALAKNMGFRTADFIRVFKKYFGASPDKYREYRQ